MKNIIATIIMLGAALMYTKNASAQFDNENSNQKFNKIEEKVDISGSSKLSNGIITIELPQKVRESLDGRKYLVSLTPFGSWSALYVKELNDKVFVVKSESGDLNAKFFWQISTPSNLEEK